MFLPRLTFYSTCASYIAWWPVCSSPHEAEEIDFWELENKSFAIVHREKFIEDVLKSLTIQNGEIVLLHGVHLLIVNILDIVGDRMLTTYLHLDKRATYSFYIWFTKLQVQTRELAIS